MIIRKSKTEIETMREAGRISARALEIVGEHVRPGVSTAELDRVAEEYIRSEGAIPAFKGLYGFPATLCTSINDQVVHGIPSKKVVLREGDVVSVDTGAKINGYYGDNAATFAVGVVDPDVARLLAVTKESLLAGVEAARVGNTLGDIGFAVQSVAEAAGFGVVRDYVGHGIGQAMHEDPNVANFGKPGRGAKLVAGMVLAIEPMVNLGTFEVHQLDDGWTVVTDDGLVSAHFEYTVAITEQGPDILTKP